MANNDEILKVDYCIGVDMAGQPIYITHYLTFELR